MSSGRHSGRLTRRRETGRRERILGGGPESSASSSSSGSSSTLSTPSTGSSDGHADGLQHALNRIYAKSENKHNKGHKRKFYRNKKFTKAMLEPVGEEHNIEYLDINDYDGHTFRKMFERRDKPCMITGATDTWKAKKKWSKKGLMKYYGDVSFQVSGERMKMKHYLQYCKRTRDDSPLYLFEDSLDTSGRESILRDYSVPEVFKYDYYGAVPTDVRPPFRWMVIGPARSGSMIHQDPLGTSAWNALIEGHKKWVIFPPHIPKEKFYPKKYTSKDAQHEAIYWFHDCYPYVKKHAKELELIECVQGPGDCIFVPADWWHGVFNPDFTVAVTQNFVSKANFKRVYARTKRERPRFCARWKKVLDYVEPEIALKAAALDSSIPRGKRWSESDSGWTDIDNLSTLDTSDIGLYDLIPESSSSSSGSSSSY